MTAIERYEMKNRIQEQEFDHAMSNIFHSFIVDGSYGEEMHLDQKGGMLEQVAQLLETYIDLKFNISRKEKLDILHLLDKINRQRAFLEIKKNELNLSNIKTASKRFGKKAQSSTI